MTRRAAVYVRISRDRKGEGAGVARQEDDCRALAERLGWEVADVYSDNDISAFSGRERPAYLRMLDDIVDGRVDAVLAWDGDRLHRNVVELDTFLSVVAREGAKVHTVRDGELTPPEDGDVTMALIRGVIAQGEAAKTRARTRRAKAQALADGKWRGGPRPFGYEADGMTIREEEAAVIRAAATDLLGGRSLAAIVREVNAAGSRTTRGNEHNTTTFRSIMLRPRNAGLTEHHGEAAGPAQWPAILEEDTWRAVVALLRNPSRQLNSGNERRWLGSGIYRCGVCGRTCRPIVNGRSVRAYTCEASRAHVSRLQEPLDDLVRRTVAERLARDDAADLLATEPDAEPLRAAQEGVVALRAREDELAGMFAAGAITASQLRAGSERLRLERERYEGEIAATSERLRLGWLATSPDPAETFLTTTLDRQRAVVDALLEVTILRAPKGRPAGWRKGDSPKIDPAYVRLAPRGVVQ